jgi:quinoprotein glucose dehydrogenase
VKLKGAAEATPMTYEGRDGRQYVVIASTGGGFFGNPVVDDSIVAFALDDSKEASSSRPVPRTTP